MKITLLVFIAIAVLLLLALGFNLETNKSIQTPTTSQKTAPANGAVSPTKDPSASVAPLAPLPVDTKQAIDSELQEIDQSLQTTDSELSADAQDGELGL